MEESWSAVECKRRSSSIDRASLKLRASQEEVCTGFWNTSKGESTRRTILQKTKSVESMCLKTKSASSTSIDMFSDCQRATVSQTISTEIASHRREIVAAAFGISTQSLERLLKFVEIIDWENITMNVSQKEQLSANLQALTSAPVNLDIPSDLGRIVAPAEQDAYSDLIMRERAESRVFAQLRASADEITIREVALGSMSQLEQAAFMSLLITSVSRCDLRTIAPSNIIANTEIFYDVAEEKMSVSGVMKRESRKEHSSKKFTSSREEIIQGFWKGERDEERVVKTLKDRMVSFKHSLSVEAASSTSENVSLGMRKADQKSEFTISQKLSPKEIVSEAYGVSESKLDQFFQVMEKMDWSNIELGEKEHTALSANIRTLAPEQKVCDGILGKLKAPKQQDESVGTQIQEIRRATAVMSVRASLLLTISSNSNFSKNISDSEKAVFSNLISVITSHNLSTIGTSSETTTASISYQDIPEMLAASKLWISRNSEKLKKEIREPVIQTVESFWNTTNDQEKVAVLLNEKIDSIYSSLNTLAASMENEIISQELVRHTENAGKVNIKPISPRELVSSSFKITSSDLQQFFNVLEKMDWSQISLPAQEHAIISKNVRSLAPSASELSNILGKLRAPEMQEETTDLKIRQAQQARVVLNVSESMSNTISSSETFSRIPENKKATLTNLVGIITTQDLSTLGASSENQTIEMDYTEAKEELEASKKLVDKNLSVLKTEIRESGDEVVQGFWNTASDKEKVGAIICEKLKSIHHTLHTHAIRTVTESLSTDIQKEQQKLSTHHFVKLSTRDVVQAAFRISSESVDHLLTLVEKMDWSKIDLVEPVYSNISSNVQALATSSSQSSGILGKLLPPAPEEETTSKEIREINTAKCILNVISSLNSTITSDASLDMISESEQAIFSNIIGVMASNNLTTSSQSTSSSFGFNNVFELSEARRVLQESNKQNLIQKVRESSEELIHGIWSTASETEKVAIVVKEKLETVHQAMKTLAIQMATQSVNSELIGSEGNLASIKSITLPTREVISAAFGISNEVIQKMLEVLTKGEWSTISLPQSEYESISQNVRALAEPSFNCDSILGKINAPGPQTETTSHELIEKNTAAAVANVKAAVESVISKESSLAKLPADEKAIITNLAGLVLSKDVSSLCTSSETFGFDQRIFRNQNANISLGAVRSETLLQRLREPIENQVQGFWSTASNQEKASFIAKQKLDTMYDTMKVIAIQMISQTIDGDFSSASISSETFKNIDKAAREVVAAEFGIANESVQKALEVLNKVEWSDISLPEKLHQNISSNVRVLADSSYNCDSIIGKLNAPEPQSAYVDQQISEHQTLEVIANIKSAVSSVISNDSVLSKRSEDEKAVISNIANLIISCDLASMSSTSNSFEFQRDILEPQNANVLLGTPASQVFTRNLQEPIQSEVQGFWSTNSSQEKASLVIRQKLNVKYDAMKMMATEIAYQSLNSNITSEETNLESQKSFDKSIRESIMASFGVSSEHVQKTLEILSKSELSTIVLPAVEYEATVQNIKALSEPNFNCESILGKLNAPDPQSAVMDIIMNEQRKLTVVSNIQSAIESVISNDSSLEKLTEVDKSVILKISEIIVSHDLTALSSSCSDFNLLQESNTQEKADIFLKTPNSQMLIERLREPIEKQVQGFWSTASNSEKQEMFLKEKVETIHAMLQTFSASLVSETVQRDFMATVQSLAALRSIQLTPREILCAAFGISNEQIEQTFRGLDEVDWSHIDIPCALRDNLLVNLRIVNADAPNVFGNLISRPDENQETSTVLEEKNRIQFLLNLQRSLDQTVQMTSSLTRSDERIEVKVSNIISLISSENLGDLISQAVQLAQPNMSDETEKSFEIPRNILLNRVVPETSEESIQSFWKTSQLAEEASSTISEKLSMLQSEFVVSAAKQVSTSLTLDYRRKIFNQNSEIIFGDLTRDVVKAAFSVSDETLNTLFSQLEQSDWSQIKLSSKQKSILSANIKSLATSNLDTLIGQLMPREADSEQSEASLSERSSVEMENTFKIQQIIFDTVVRKFGSDEERASIINLIGLLTSVNLKAAIQVASFERLPDSLDSTASITPVFKIQEHVRQPTEQVVQGFWSKERHPNETVEVVNRKIEVLKSILNCYAVAECHKSLERSLEKPSQQDETCATRGVTEVVQNAFAVTEQSYSKILKVLGSMQNFEIPEAVKETISKNLKILNLPPVDTLLVSKYKESHVSKTVEEQELVQFMFNFKSALNSEIEMSQNVSKCIEEETVVLPNLVAILASANLATIVPTESRQLSDSENILNFSIQHEESERSAATVRDEINILRHYLQTFAIQKASSEVSRVIEIIKTSQSFHLVHTTMLEEIKTIQLRMEVLKRVSMNQSTAEELLQEAFQNSEQQMETFQRIVQNVHWEETKLTEEIIRNLRINMTAIPRFESTVGSLKAPDDQHESADSYISSTRRAEAVINLMAAADNAISTSSTLSMMESDERLLHKTILKTMAVCNLTTPASRSETETMTQGFYQKVEQCQTEQELAERPKINCEMKECVFTTCTGYTEMNKPDDAEITTFSALLGTLSICDLVTMASSNIQVDSKYDYYRRPAPKNAETTFTESNADAFSLALQEAGEVTSSGIWSTVSNSDAAKTTVSDKLISISKTEMSMKAVSENAVNQDHSLKKDSIEAVEMNIPDSRKEILQKNYSIDRSNSTVEMQGAIASEDIAIQYSAPRVDNVSQTMRSQSQKDLLFGGSFGELEPPLPQEEDVETTARQSRVYRSSSQVRAPSEESIQKTEALRRSESLESNARKTFVDRRRENVSLSRKASVERETNMEARVAKADQSIPVETLQKSKKQESIFSSVVESKDLNVCGSWTTAKPPIGAKVSLQTKKVEKEVTSATMTVASASVECEVGLESKREQSRDATGSMVRAKSIEEVEREFGVEVTSTEKTLEKRDQIESWIKSIPQRLEVEESAEFGNDEVIIGGVMGSLEAPLEQEEETEKLLTMKRSASEARSLKAATKESIEEADEFSKIEADQEILTVQKELVKATGILNAAASREINASSKMEYSKVPSEDVIELSLTESRRQSNSGQFKETKEEEIVGLWNTGTKGENASKVLPHKPPIDTASMKAKAAKQNSIEMTGSLQKSPSAEAMGIVSQKVTEGANSKFGIAQGAVETTLTASAQSGVTCRDISVSNIGVASETVTQFSNKETGIGFGASNLIAPPPESAETEFTGKISNLSQTSLNKMAASDVGTTVESKIQAPGDNYGDVSLLQKVASSDAITKAMQASRDSAISVDFRQDRETVSAEKSDLNFKSTNSETQKLKLFESKEEESGIFIRSSHEYEETQKTLRHRSASRESASRTVTAPTNQEVQMNFDKKVEDSVAEGSLSIGIVRESSQSEVMQHAERTSELTKLSMNEEVAGVRAVSETTNETFRGYQQGDVEVQTGAAMGRIEAPRPQRGEAEITQKLRRTLSVERSAKASEMAESQTVTQIQKREDSLASEYSVRDTLLLKSSSVSHVATEQMSEHLVMRSKSEHHISEKLQERLIEKESFSSQEFISENQGVHTHWDVIDNNGDALICWKSSETEQKSLDAKQVTEELAGTTLDLSVRLLGGTDEEKIAEHVIVGASEVLNISETRADMEMSRQDAFSDDATYVASDILEERSLSTVHEFGESEASTTFGVGKLVTKKPEKEEVGRSFSETRKLSQFSDITAISETTTDMDSEILRLPECDQSVTLISHKNQQKDVKDLKATVENTADQVTLLEKREVREQSADVKKKKFEVEDIEEVLPMIRRWAEILSMKASTSVEIQAENKLSKPEAQAESQKYLKTANLEINKINVNATHEEVMSATTALECKTSGQDVASIRLRDKSRERVEKKYQENQWNLLSTNAEWETLLNDLEDSVTIAQSVQDSMAFSVKASATVNLNSDTSIKKAQPEIGIQKSISQSNVEKTVGQFSSATIGNELLVTRLGMDLEEIETLVDEINREQAVGGRIREFGKSETGGGIYLVRRALPKVKETSTHTVTVATSFRQIFSTMSAGDEISEANVELTIPSTSVGAEIKSTVARSDSMTFSTSHASEYTASTVADYARDIAVSASTAARKKAIPTERTSQKLKEVGADGIEILSLWEGIETDLDATTQLVDLLRVKSSLQTIESSEEVERINQYLEMPEEKGLVIHLINVQNKETCERNFAVSICSLDTVHSRKSEIPPTYSVSKVLTEKRVLRETWRVIESGDVRFNAVINLHRYSLSKPTLAQETVLREVVRIAAQPLFISAGDIESDVVWSTHQLEKTFVREEIDRTIIGARKGENIKKKFEEAGDEKVKLKVELIGGNLPNEICDISWKIPRLGGKVKLETEEFEFDECLFLWSNQLQADRF
nr:hypothetical protein B0228.3 - Caenorhabditis elegans [Caenorhabditis elegans]